MNLFCFPLENFLAIEKHLIQEGDFKLHGTSEEQVFRMLGTV